MKSWGRYAVALVLLVAIVGGIAWVAQYLPNRFKKIDNPPPPSNNKLVEFPRTIALWGEPPAPGEFVSKDFEPGTKGHYDFPFKSNADADVEVIYFASDCDCASVQVGALAAEEWQSVAKIWAEKPAEPIAYAKEPIWLDLIKAPEWQKLPADAKAKGRLVVKPGEAGVVRVHWRANKLPGQELRVRPAVVFQRAGDPSQRGLQVLGIPLMMAAPVYFYPPRVSVGALTSGTSAKAEFDAWSSTRDQLDLDLLLIPADPLFTIEVKPLTKDERADLEAALKEKKIGARARSAVHVTVTVHESMAGKQLDLGSFYRKLAAKLDGFLDPSVSGPEIVGRVRGEVGIGGADDQGRIRFPPFSAKDGMTKTVELSADAKLQLELYDHVPRWVKVSLTRAKQQDDPKRATWRLEVVVEPNTLGIRSFEEPDAVTLRIVGTPERFVRIPIEGTVSAGAN